MCASVVQVKSGGEMDMHIQDSASQHESACCSGRVNKDGERVCWDQTLAAARVPKVSPKFCGIRDIAAVSTSSQEAWRRHAGKADQIPKQSLAESG